MNIEERWRTDSIEWLKKIMPDHDLNPEEFEEFYPAALREEEKVYG